MTKGKTEQVQAEIVVPEVVQQELTLLRGFRDLMAERVGYSLGISMLNETMREKTEAERKANLEARKNLRKNLETFIQNADIEGYKKALEETEKTRKALNEARKPHLAKISPLRKAIKYIDNVAVPDSLKELGVTVQPTFSLSDWVKKAIETKKKRK